MKAWEKSGSRFARAMRSLAAHYYRLDKHQDAIDCYQKALEINPLFTNSWFVMGCAAMHVEHWEVATAAFNRVVNIDPDNAEAWTNLASVLIRTKRKVDAWRALREALKSMFDNFKIWENYLYTCVDIGEFEECLLAIRRLVDIRCEKTRNVDQFLDAQVIEILIVAMKDGKLDRSGNPASRLITKMQELLEYVSSKITLTSELWKLFASLYVLSGDYRKCLETLTKRSNYWMDHAELNMDVAVFKNAVEAVVDLADAYKNYGGLKQANRMDDELVPVAKDWHYSGRKALRLLASRTKDSFEDTNEHNELLQFIQEF